jgi:hypothetical protein
MTAVFYAMGFVVLLSRFRQNAYRFIIIWMALAMLTSGFFSPYNRTPEDRMQLVIPVAAIVTGIGVYETLRLLTVPALSSWQPRVARFLPVAFFAAFLPIMVFFNVVRFWVITPANTPTSIESVIARAVFWDECADRAAATVVLSPEPAPVLEPLFGSYNMGDDAPVLVRFDDALQNSQFDPTACFVLSHLFDERANTLRTTLAQQYPEKQTKILQDKAHLREVLVYY